MSLYDSTFGQVNVTYAKDVSYVLSTLPRDFIPEKGLDIVYIATDPEDIPSVILADVTRNRKSIGLMRKELEDVIESEYTEFYVSDSTPQAILEDMVFEYRSQFDDD